MITNAPVPGVALDQIDDIGKAKNVDVQGRFFGHLPAGGGGNCLSHLLQTARQTPFFAPRRLTAANQKHTFVFENDSSDADERRPRVEAAHSGRTGALPGNACIREPFATG